DGGGRRGPRRDRVGAAAGTDVRHRLPCRHGGHGPRPLLLGHRRPARVDAHRLRLRCSGDGGHVVHAELARLRVRTAFDPAPVPVFRDLLSAVDLPTNPADPRPVHAAVPRRRHRASADDGHRRPRHPPACPVPRGHGAGRPAGGVAPHAPAAATLMPKRRLGVALLVPPPFDREVDALRLACDDGALGRIPSHLTLVPPVNVREDAMDDALRAVRSAAASTSPLLLQLGPPATFLPDNPTLFMTVSGPGLDGLRALRDRVFTPPLERPLTWPFVPHVTIADEMASDRIAAAVDALAGYQATVTFERVHLLEETKTPAGRVWRPIADASFAAP